MCESRKLPRGLCGVVVKLLAFKAGVVGSIPDFSSLSGETLNRGHMTFFNDKLLTRTYCDEAGDYAVPNVLSPRGLVFKPDIGYKMVDHRETSTGYTPHLVPNGYQTPSTKINTSWMGAWNDHSVMSIEIPVSLVYSYLEKMA